MLNAYVLNDGSLGVSMHYDKVMDKLAVKEMGADVLE